MNQTYKERGQDIAISKWCQQKGITWAYIQQHPHPEDIGILLEVRDHFWTRMLQSEKHSWGGYWRVVYHNRRPLKRKKFFRRFQEITKRIDKQELIMAQQRRRIQGLRRIKQLALHQGK